MFMTAEGDETIAAACRGRKGTGVVTLAINKRAAQKKNHEHMRAASPSPALCTESSVDARANTLVAISSAEQLR